MVKLKSLKNDPNSRTVRAIVDSPFGQIRVFEPTTEDIDAIINLQDIITAFNEESGEVEENEEGILDISELTVVQELFPRLTDLEIDYMSDEEIQDVISHPNLALAQVKLIIAGIISDVYKMIILTMNARLKEEDLKENSTQVKDKVMGITMERLTKSEKGKEILDAMNEAEKLDKAIESGDPEIQEKVAEESRMKLVAGNQEDSYRDQLMKKYVGDKYNKLVD